MSDTDKQSNVQQDTVSPERTLSVAINMEINQMNQQRRMATNNAQGINVRTTAFSRSEYNSKLTWTKDEQPLRQPL